jgi:hypothetical protein
VSEAPHPTGEEAAGCGICDRRWTEVDGGRAWIHLEVTRSDGADGYDYLWADFCTQAHAAEWLARPLPPVIRGPAGPTVQTSWSERLLTVALVLGTAWALGLMLLGSYALVDLLGGWD